MSDAFWNKLNNIVGLMAIAVLFGLTAFSANLEIKDLDLWLHIKTGQYIVEHQTVPDHDVLSCSIAGKPWVNHEWLFQVIVYNVQKNFGFDGLITMQSVVVTLTFLVLLLLVYRRDRQWLIAFSLLLVLLVYQSRFTIRPDIFSLLFFALDMYILAMHIDKRWSIFALALIQLLWVNMHGFALFGPILIGVGIIAELIKRKVPLPYEWNQTGRLNEDEFKRLWVLLGVLLLVCLINPLGIQGALYPIKVLFQTTGESKVFFQHIFELQKPIPNIQSFLKPEHMHYKILIVISFVSFVFNRRYVDVSVFLIWLVFLLFSLAAIRNLVFFACAAYLVIMVNSMTIELKNILPLKFSEFKFKALTVVIAKCALIFWMLDYGLQSADHGYFDFDTFERKSEYGGVSKRSFPYQAVDFIIAQNIKGNFFNDFNSGAYLVGRTYPNIKVFIDGRTEVYGAQFFNNYQKIWRDGDKKTFEEAVDKYHLTGAFLNGANQEIPPKAIRLLYGMKDWRLVYFDYDGMIFLKNIPENQAVITRYAIDLNKWHSPKMDLLRLGSKKCFPFPFIDRARDLMALKLDRPALEELREALKIEPDIIDVYQMLGDIYGHQKQYRKAFENYRIAVVSASGDINNRMRLAWSYEKLGDYTGAIKQYERILAGKPNDVKILGKIKKCKERLNKSKAIQKTNQKSIQKITHK